MHWNDENQYQAATPCLFTALPARKQRLSHRLPVFPPLVSPRLALPALPVHCWGEGRVVGSWGGGEGGGGGLSADFVCCFAGWALKTSQQHASVSQGRTCSDNCTCCHAEIEVADHYFYLIQSYILTLGQPVPALTLQRQAPGSVTAGAPIFKSLVRQDPKKNLSANLKVTGKTRPGIIPEQAGQSDAQSGSQGEGRGREDDQAEDGKMT